MADAFNDIAKQLPKFSGILSLKKQATSCNDSNTNATVLNCNICILQMNFTANFTCLWQNESQSTVWKQLQVTIYTILAYNQQ